MLERLERPLLCSSIRPADQLSGSLPDAAVLLDEFAPRGLDFVVDDGRQVGAARAHPHCSHTRTSVTAHQMHTVRCTARSVAPSVAPRCCLRAGCIKTAAVFSCSTLRGPRSLT